MASTVNQTDVLTDMSYLLGEATVPSSGIDDRKSFIDKSMERITRSYNFEALKAIATISLATGQATMPTNINYTPPLDVRIVNSGVGDDYIFELIPYEDRDKYNVGDYKYWLTGTEGAYTLYTKETASSTLSLRYTQKAPGLNASISTTFPSSMVIARGALVYYKQAENPQADISVDEALFQKELQEVVAAEIRNRPIARGKGVQEINDTYTGAV